MTSVGWCETPKDAAPLRLQARLFWLLGRASKAADAATRDSVADVGLPRGCYGVLASLVEFGPAAQAEIGRRLRIDRSDMVAIINTLEGEGLVARLPDPTDGRRHSVTVTRAGRRVLARFDRAVERAEEAVLSGLAPEERALLLELLQRLVGADDAVRHGSG